MKEKIFPVTARWNRTAGLLAFITSLAALLVFQVAGPPEARAAETVLFQEAFEDTNWTSRGWYDEPAINISSVQYIEGSHSCVWHWQFKGNVLPLGKGGRVQIKPVESVTLSYYVKHSDNWTWTGVNYHPHEFLFTTNLNDAYTGPAFTHLTLYIEAVDGRGVLGIQDGQNIDQARIGQDLTNITENRSVAGGNGDSDGYKGDYYKNGDVYWNGKVWDTDSISFSDVPGPYYKGDWHHVKARFKLNSIKDGKGVNDGIVQYWYDDTLLIDHHDVLFRTGKYPGMKINQFLMLPYYGPGVPHEQYIWIDNLKITEEEELPDDQPADCDFNGDGKVNIIDVISMLLRGRETPQDARLDWNRDGTYSVTDAIALLLDIIKGNCP